MKNFKVYQAEKNNKHYWFFSKSKKNIIEMYPFLSIKDISTRLDCRPEPFFEVIFKNENGLLDSCKYEFYNK